MPFKVSFNSAVCRMILRPPHSPLTPVYGHFVGHYPLHIVYSTNNPQVLHISDITGWIYIGCLVCLSVCLLIYCQWTWLIPSSVILPWFTVTPVTITSLCIRTFWWQGELAELMVRW